MQRGLIALVSGVAFLLLPLVGGAQQPKSIALFPMKNEANLPVGDADTLSNAVSGRFLEKLGADRVLFVPSADEPCDDFCARRTAMEMGAGTAVIGTVKTFGGSLLVELVAAEAGTGKILGRVNSPPVSSVPDLLPATETLADKLAEQLSRPPEQTKTTKLTPTPVQVYTNRTRSVPVPDPDRPGSNGYGSDGYSTPAPSGAATIHVSSEPSGATVRMGGVFTGPVVGTTPYTAHVSPGVHTITVEKKDYTRKERRLRLQMGEDKTLHFKLRPHSTLLAMGHVAFWSGLILEFPAMICYAATNGSSDAPKAMSIGGGALMLTGITLFIIRAVKMKKLKRARTIRRGVTMLPTPDQGIAIAYGQTF